MRMLRSIRHTAAMRVRVGTKDDVPRPTWAVDTSAKTKVAVKVLSAYFRVRSRRNQATNRGENSLVPNWTTMRTTAVTNPVKASMPLPRADSAELALEELMVLESTTGSLSSQWRNTMLSASAARVQSSGTTQRLCQISRMVRCQWTFGNPVIGGPLLFPLSGDSSIALRRRWCWGCAMGQSEFV